MRKTIIVAAAANHAIGFQGRLLWHLPQDMRFFKNTTWGMPVIMGRKTFESLGKPLPGRTNIVLTKQPDWQFEGVFSVDSLEAAFAQAAKLQTEEVFLIGGAEVYRQALPYASQVLLTRVHTVPQQADTWFPALHTAEWQLKAKQPFLADEKHAFDYTFERWERR